MRCRMMPPAIPSFLDMRFTRPLAQNPIPRATTTAAENLGKCHGVPFSPIASSLCCRSIFDDVLLKLRDATEQTGPSSTTAFKVSGGVVQCDQPSSAPFSSRGTTRSFSTQLAERVWQQGTSNCVGQRKGTCMECILPDVSSCLFGPCAPSLGLVGHLKACRYTTRTAVRSERSQIQTLAHVAFRSGLHGCPWTALKLPDPAAAWAAGALCQRGREQGGQKQSEKEEEEWEEKEGAEEEEEEEEE